MRALGLIKSYPVIVALVLLCGRLLWSAIRTEEELAAAMLRIHTLESMEPLVQECNDAVEIIQSDCRAEIKEALDSVKPVKVNIKKPAKNVKEFNEWITERIE